MIYYHVAIEWAYALNDEKSNWFISIFQKMSKSAESTPFWFLWRARCPAIHKRTSFWKCSLQSSAKESTWSKCWVGRSRNTRSWAIQPNDDVRPFEWDWQGNRSRICGCGSNVWSKQSILSCTLIFVMREAIRATKPAYWWSFRIKIDIQNSFWLYRWGHGRWPSCQLLQLDR